ncbi:hypothetical protein LOAG_12498 [Loa loa]|uniref:BHLH domain-containing protein n=2 Tax=Loa loa TaxID=7209 RepID=A0A1S0TL41_LOALO|nr:hypothetical protein LOAG_12498 [Loa loa]EFO16010.1 hypothetical protein LOAG_12498 [Loa loa]
MVIITTKTTTIQTVRSRTTKFVRWSKRRHERKQVLEELRRIVPFVNEHTPLLELLQKVIDYITELQELVNNSSVNTIENKENIISWRRNDSNYKTSTNNCAYIRHHHLLELFEMKIE